MNYTIICAANSSLGLGHLARCLTLASDLLALNRHVSIIVFGSKSLVKFCRAQLKGYPQNFELNFLREFSQLRNLDFLNKESTTVIDIPNVEIDVLTTYLSNKPLAFLDYFHDETNPSCIINILIIHILRY